MNNYKIKFRKIKNRRSDRVLKNLFITNQVKKYCRENKIKICKLSLKYFFNTYVIIRCSKDEYYEFYKYLVCNQKKLKIKILSEF